MQFGHFDDSAREYVITTPHTPVAMDQLPGVAGVLLADLAYRRAATASIATPGLRRLTRYRYNNVPGDSGGRIFYINDDGDVWNPGYRPYKAALDDYECRHGMGYTRITGEEGGLRASVLFFVPVDINAEIQQPDPDQRIQAVEKRFSLFSLRGVLPLECPGRQTNFQRNLSTGEVEVEGWRDLPPDRVPGAA